MSLDKTVEDVKLTTGASTVGVVEGFLGLAPHSKIFYHDR